MKKTVAEMKQELGPKKTVKAYKLFRVHPDHPGKLFPLYVDSTTPVEMNKWVDAKAGEMDKGKVKSKLGPLAYRPGWHAGDLPMATHIGSKSDPKNMKNQPPDQRPDNQAWAEVEMPDDKDWQSEANKRGMNAKGKLIAGKAHITDQLPVGGHYRYKTNPNMSGNWLIGGSLKVNKVLTDDEVNQINKKAGVADLPRIKPFNKKEYGFAEGGTIKGKAMPTIAQMKMALSRAPDLRNMGVNQAIGTRAYSNPDPQDNGLPPVGGVSDSGGLPVGGVDTDSTVPGQQMTPQVPNQPTQPFPPAQGGMQPPVTPAIKPQPPTMGNMLSMTPQGQTLDALAPAGIPEKAEGGRMLVYTHHVVDPQDSHRIMGKYQSASAARNARDRLDNKYGAYRYKVRLIPQANESMRDLLKKGGQVIGLKGGGSKGYLEHKPLKPNPEVGKRFVATPQGNLAKRKRVNLADYENKGSIVPVPYDATTRDNLVTEVSGRKLTDPLLTQGGNDYSLDKQNIANNIGGASNKLIADRVQKRINTAQEEHGGDVLLMPSHMSDDGEHFSHHPIHIALDLLKQQDLGKNKIKELDEDIRKQFVNVTNKLGQKQKIFPFTKFLGFKHPEVANQIMKGGYGLETSPGNLRKILASRLSSVANQKLLNYNIEDLKSAILDPDISTDPTGYMGHTVVRTQPGASLRPSKHLSYDSDYAGTNIGGMGGNAPIEVYMPDRYQDVEKELIARPTKTRKSSDQMRAQVIGALEKRKDRIAQPINSRVVNNAGLYQEGLLGGEFNPKNLNEVLAYFKRKGGYNKGGKVNKDTMKLELSKKKAG